MMKGIKLTIGLLAIAGSAFAQKASVKGNISGLEDGPIVFHYSVAGTPQTDTVETKNGEFSWSADMPEPLKVYMMFPSRYVQFFAEKGNIAIRGVADALDKLKVTGSALQDESDAYEASIKDLSDQENAIYLQWGKGSVEEQRHNEQKLERIRAEKRVRMAQYVATNPKSYLSLNMVNDQAAMGSYESIKPLYEQLDPSMQNTALGKVLAERLTVLKRSVVGTPILEFTQNDTEGKHVSIAAFKGKYVLVDFWASWCGPCRAENPNLLKEYNKYKDKNFTVVGVSLDDNGDRWKKAIEEDGMPWTQLSDLKGWENEVSTYYGIRGIPSSLLIDPEGKIIAKDLRGEMLAKKLEELFD